MPRMRRKSIYGTLVLSSILFIATVWLNDNNEDEQYTTVKMVTGISAKFLVTVYFASAYTMMAEINPTGIRQSAAAIQV